MADPAEIIQPTKGISGSLIAAIAGFNPWSDAVYAYNNIFGLADQEEGPAASWGQKLEPLIARQYAEDHGVLLWPHTDFGLDYKKSFLVHPTYDWATGTPDRLVIHDPKWLIPLDLFIKDPEAAQELARQQLNDPNFWEQVLWGWEGKTAGPRMLRYWGEEGTDDIPPLYMCQSVWYQGLTLLERWDLSVLLGGQDFRTYYLLRKDTRDLEQMLYSVGKEFWEKHILTRTPPPRDASPAWKSFFKRWFPQEIEPLKPADAETERMMVDLWKVSSALKELSDQDETLRNEIRLRIGEAAGVEGVWQEMPWKFTWQKNKDSQKVDWEELCKKLKEYAAALIQKRDGSEGLASFMEGTYPSYLAHCTKTIEGARVLRTSWPKPPKEKKGKK